MQSQEEIQVKNFRKQLAACVMTMRWSYAIFWSMSARKEGLLEWNDGYYNGDIKTRKTTQITVCKADQLGLQRSEQLRELFESLSTGDRNLQNKRPASLSPEDLTDAEWYYLVCMSFTFNLGQDLPGKVYECNEPIWLCNAQLAENRIFCRSLLAKSASIQTVVCLPFMDGVLEFGTSDLVMEDADFVKSITSSFWDLQLPAFSENSTSSHPLAGKEDENACTILDNKVEGTMFLENPALVTQNCFHVFPFASNALNKETEFILDNATEHHASICEEIIYTPDGSSNVPNKGVKRMTGLLEGQMGHLMDDEFSNGLHEYLSCGVLTSPRGERVKRNMLDVAQVDNHAHLCSLDADGDGLHYASTISAVLAYSKEQTTFPGFRFKNCSNESSFNIWKEGPKASKIHSKTPQRMLKKILIDGNWMNDRQMKYQEEKEENVARNKSFKSEADDTNANHVLSERRRREKLNEKFVILRSLVPSISKVDKASILADTIEYLKELERRVEELESCKGDTDLGMTKRSSHPDIAERTSDNYGNNRLNCQVTSTKKRKACDTNEAEGEHPLLPTKGGAVDINVTTTEKEVLVEMRCPWRNFLLLHLVEALSNIQLDVHLVQSSTLDGFLAITMRAKVVNTVIASPWMIKRALQRVVKK